MTTYSFYEFSNYKKRSDVFAFLDSYSGTINESVLQELYANFGDDDVVNEAWGDWLNKAKGMAQNVATGAVNMAAGAVKGAKEFGQGFVQGSQQGYKDSRTEDGVKKIESIAAKVGELSKSFTQKYKIDPVTAAIIIGSGATGGMGTVPMLALAIGLRKGSAWLAGKGMDAAWKKVTGKTPAELDQMWQSKINDPKAAPAAGAKPATPPPVPAAGAKPATPPPVPAARPTAPDSDQFHYEMFKRPKTSFATFLENKDADLYQNIIDEGMWDNAKGFLTGALNKGADIAKGYAKDIGDQGFARATGSLVGKGAGQAAGTFANSVIVFAKSLKNAASFMANNPVKTGTMMMAIAAGSMIGSYGTQAINNFIHKPSADQIQDLTAAAKQAGVPDSEIQSMHKDSGFHGLESKDPKALDQMVGGGANDTASSGTGGDSYTAPGAEKFLPSKDTQTYYANQDTNYKTMPTVGSPEDIAMKKSFLPQDNGPTGADFVPKDPNYKGLYSATPKLNDMDGTTMPRWGGDTFDGKTWSGGKMSIPTHKGGR